MSEYGWLILCLPLLAMLAPLISVLICIPLGFLVGLFNEPAGRAILRFGSQMAGNGPPADPEEGGARATDVAGQMVEDRQSIARSWGHTNSGGSDWWNQR